MVGWFVSKVQPWLSGGKGAQTVIGFVAHLLAISVSCSIMGSHHLSCGGCLQVASSDSDVVDLQLRWLGVTGLRIADCSVMRSLVSGNTNAPTMIIADRDADFVFGESGR
jgi:choline dehydrogenase-like flavoprotein